MKTQRGAWFLPLLLLLGAPVHAQSLCENCLNAAQKELAKCLEEAISQEDKKTCAEKKEARSKSCSDGECKIEREAIPKELVPEKK